MSSDRIFRCEMSWAEITMVRGPSSRITRLQFYTDIFSLQRFQISQGGFRVVDNHSDEFVAAVFARQQGFNGRPTNSWHESTPRRDALAWLISVMTPSSQRQAKPGKKSRIFSIFSRSNRTPERLRSRWVDSDMERFHPLVPQDSSSHAY